MFVFLYVFVCMNVCFFVCVCIVFFHLYSPAVRREEAPVSSVCMLDGEFWLASHRPMFVGNLAEQVVSLPICHYTTIHLEVS